MKAGKPSQAIYSRSVLRQLHSEEKTVRVGPAIGFNYAATEVLGHGLMITAMDTVTFPDHAVARRAILHAQNHIAAAGAAPVGIEASLLYPTVGVEQGLRELVKEIDIVSHEAQVPVLGVHTQICRNSKTPILTVTAMGTAQEDSFANMGTLCPGMDLVISKWIGLEGTALLAQKYEESLAARFAYPFIRKAGTFLQYLSVAPEAAVAGKSGVRAMFDISEGGVFGALWEMAERAGVGLEIDLKKIPIRQETVEICEFFDVNPYKLASGGSLLMATENGNTLVHELEKEGIPAVMVGKVVSGNDRILYHEDEQRFLETAQQDELYKVFRD